MNVVETFEEWTRETSSQIIRPQVRRVDTSSQIILHLRRVEQNMFKEYFAAYMSDDESVDLLGDVKRSETRRLQRPTMKKISRQVQHLKSRVEDLKECNLDATLSFLVSDWHYEFGDRDQRVL